MVILFTEPGNSEKLCLGERWGSVALLYSRNWYSIAHHLCFGQPTGENGFTFVNGWIKSKGEYSMMCKLYAIQISVSIKFYWNKFIPLLSIPMSTLWWQLSSWDRNHMWHSHNCTRLLDALQIAVTKLWLSSVVIPQHFIFTIMSKQEKCTSNVMHLKCYMDYFAIELDGKPLFYAMTL